MILKRALHYSHELLAKVIRPGDTALDATCGNGHDTLFMAQLAGPNGHIFACDIQSSACENTKARLKNEKNIAPVSVLCTSHDAIDQHLPADISISAAIFNLGYLPKGDKNIITTPDATISAISKLLPFLKPAGLLLIVAYYGHPGGLPEKEAVLKYCQKLPQERYNVLTYSFINQQNCPPILIAIEKK